MQDACDNEPSKYDLANHESPSSSVVRAPDQRTGGHGFDSRRGLRFSLCPRPVTIFGFPLLRKFLRAYGREFSWLNVRK